MATSRQEGGSPGWNVFPELDFESAAPPPLQIVSWPSSPWRHQMAFDFESYRDCRSDYIPRNIRSTRSSPDGDGEGLALSPLWKFSDVSYPSVHHPNAPNRFSPFPLTISVPPLTLDEIACTRISTVAWEDIRLECEIHRFFSHVSVSYDEDENERLISTRKRLMEKTKKENVSLSKMLLNLSRDFEQYLELSELRVVARCKLAVFKELNIEGLEELSDRSCNKATKSLGDSLSPLKPICKSYGIPRWPPGNRNENERSMSESKSESELKGKQLCVRVPEIGFNQTSLPSNPLYDPTTICQSATCFVHAPVSNLHLEELVTADIQEVKELKRDKSKRRCGKTAKSISLEDLEERSHMNRKEAANSLQVSVPTLKRICRRRGIPRWPPTKRNEDECSMYESELKGKSSCVGVPEVAFNQTSLTGNPLSDMVGPSTTMPNSLNSCSQQNSLAYDPTTICQSATYSVHAPVSMQLGLRIEQIPKFIQSDPQCSNLHLQQLVTADISPPQTTVQGVESIAIKATFGDLIKFDLLSSSQMVNLEEEVAKRLKLKHGNFKLKYMDEENDWVLIACDVDLKRCIDTMRSMGRTTIRMLVQPINH